MKCKDCIHEKVCVHKANITSDAYAYMGVKYDTEKCDHFFPADDVVPREACADMHRAICKIQAYIGKKYNSVSDLAIIDDYYKGQTVLLLMLEGFIANLVKEYEVNGSLHLDENEKPKSDVVREIFEEIDRVLNAEYAALDERRHKVQDPDALDSIDGEMTGLDVSMQLIEDLKKKYTEDETDA